VETRCRLAATRCDDAYQLSDTGRQYVVISAGGYAQLGTTLGDYLIAFALPRPGATPVPPVPAALTGTYTGELIPERRRMVATLTLLEDSGGAVTGTLTTHDPAITGTLTGTRTAGTLTYAIIHLSCTQSCSGTIEGTAELANAGRLLVGGLRVSGACSARIPIPVRSPCGGRERFATPPGVWPRSRGAYVRSVRLPSLLSAGASTVRR
jgi:hypothetical protein